MRNPLPLPSGLSQATSFRTVHLIMASYVAMAPMIVWCDSRRISVLMRWGEFSRDPGAVDDERVDTEFMSTDTIRVQVG